MTNDELQNLFNRVHSTYTAAIYDYSKTKDFKKIKEATTIFNEFILQLEELINENIEGSSYLTSLSFRNIESDKLILKQKKKTSADS